MRHFIIFITVIISFLSCRKDTTNEIIDKRDKYIGTYSGIQIYIDNQQQTKDTTDVVIYLKKFDQDTISAIELVLPVTNQRYLYDIINDSLVFQGFFYHCPIITIKKDSLFCTWTPSLAPRIYKFETIKEIQ